MEPTNVSHIPISQRRLEHFMKSHDGSWGEDIIRDVILRADTIFPNGTIPRFQTLMLYYEILVNVYRAKKKKKPKTLRAILTCDIFHRCLLACAAAEQVSHTSSTASKLFPADRVLESSGITAFDLSHTITTSFVRHERSFPGYFNRDLNSFKLQLLESIAWKKGSSLFNSLSLVRPSLSPEINRLGLLMPPSFHETKLDLETTSPSKACAETKLNIFFREHCILFLRSVCWEQSEYTAWLILSQRTRENVYSLFQRILNERTHLFFNRHIDQIMLSCFYIVTQRSKLNLSITEIIHSYKQQPECRPHVFLSVFVDCPLAGHDDDGPSASKTGQEEVDIITFYNDIFIPSVWPLVLELDTDGATVKSDQLAEVYNTKDGHLAQCLGSPTIVPFPRFPVMDREKLHPTKNLRVFPLSSSEIIMLGAVRINGMAEKLELSQQKTEKNVGENVFYLFQQILTQQPHLFTDLHIDLIILCCFRGVAKNLSFKEIIASYRMQLQCTPPVFHSEFVDWPLARLDWPYGKTIVHAHITSIAKYYNDIFFPYVKPLLLELPGGVTTAGSYKIAEFNSKNDDHLAQCPEPPFPSIPVMSVEEVSATHYACVSPMGSSEIIMVGAVRIRSMVEMLRLSQQIRENVYRLFESILHEQTSLFFNRHIDHIILCCFCAVAKISKLSLTFKEIISSYKKQPQCNPRVFDRVFVDWSLACPDSAFGKRIGQEHVDIVTFCNQIFIPSVEPLLLELGAEAAT